MNYKKIYDDLISTRKQRGKIEGVYGEWHHIKPRSMGGGDEPENLVWLTAREHCIAHLLLAHIHGGRMWIAATAMDLIVGDRKGMNSRLVAIARREAAKAMSGDNAPNADKTLYRVKNLLTGEIKEGTRAYMNDVWGITPVRMYMLITGRVQRYTDFCMADTVIAEHLIKDKLYKFKKVVTGEIIERTRRQMFEEFSLSWQGSLRLLKGNIDTSEGFALAEPKEVVIPKLYAFKKIATQELIVTDRYTLEDEYGLKLKDSAKLMRNVSKTSYGFEYVGAVVDGEIVPAFKPVRHKKTDCKVKNYTRKWVCPEDGVVYELSRTELRDKFGIPLRASKDVLSGKCKTYKGWYIEGADISDKSHDNQIYKIKNISSGEVMSVTRKFMMRELGLSRSQATNLTQGINYNNGGYCLADAVAPPEDLWWPDKNTYTWEIVTTGEVVSKTKKQAHEDLGLRSQDLTNLMKGRAKTARGVRFLGKEETPEEVS